MFPESIPSSYTSYTGHGLPQRLKLRPGSWQTHRQMRRRRQYGGAFRAIATALQRNDIRQTWARREHVALAENTCVRRRRDLGSTISPGKASCCILAHGYEAATRNQRTSRVIEHDRGGSRQHCFEKYSTHFYGTLGNRLSTLHSDNVEAMCDPREEVHNSATEQSSNGR